MVENISLSLHERKSSLIQGRRKDCETGGTWLLRSLISSKLCLSWCFRDSYYGLENSKAILIGFFLKKVFYFA